MISFTTASTESTDTLAYISREQQNAITAALLVRFSLTDRSGSNSAHDLGHHTREISLCFEEGLTVYYVRIRTPPMRQASHILRCRPSRPHRVVRNASLSFGKDLCPAAHQERGKADKHVPVSFRIFLCEPIATL